MHGDFLGGAAALLYFLAFQVCGVLLAACFFKNERRWVQAVLGSAAGSVLLMWLPALWAFAFGFSLAAHLLALALLLLLTALALWRRRPALRVPKKTAAPRQRGKRKPKTRPAAKNAAGRLWRKNKNSQVIFSTRCTR